MNKILSVLLCLLSLSSAWAQDKYWVSFKDKDTSSYSYSHYLSKEAIENRNTFNLPLYQYSDVPVNTAYLHALETMGVQTLYPSRWLNSVSAYMTGEQVKVVRQLDFVSEITPIDQKLQLASCGIAVNPAYVHIAMKQMQINSFIDDSLTGKGVVMGVIDAGFYQAQTDKMLRHIFDEHKIIAQKDFLSPERSDLITEKATDADYHGRMVLDMIAGYNAITRELTGMAPNTRFYLARTEHGDKEFRGEEDTWIAAMEWMDSKGVRLISTSLGYAIKMDDPNDNYTQREMDGKTTRISKAAQIATDEKGIFLVVSAGNEGSNPNWQIISSPADAQGVLSIGATKSDNCERIEYSSIGPEFLPYLKPNVSCYSPNGTSFSAPAIAGFVACMMQKAPTMDNKKMKALIEKSAHLYPYGNNFIGYGIPRASRALKLIEDPTFDFGTATLKEVNKKSFALHNKKGKKQEVVLFHKKNEFVVTDQKTVSFSKSGKLKIRKPSDVARTTVTYLDTVIEVVWK
jgi:subtilisin family serine protease